MRILMNAASAKRGGIVTYTRNLAAYMRERDIEVKVAAPPDFMFDDPSILLPVAAGDFGPFRRVLWEQIFWRYHIRKYSPDVLFSSANFGLFHSPVPQVLLMREGGLFDPLYLSHVAPSQGVEVQFSRHFRRRMMLMSARHAHHVITPSHAMRDSLIGWDASLEGKSSVNHYGARPDLFSRAAAPRRWRQDGTYRLLYVSVYYPHKCPAIVCRAVEALALSGLPAHSTITITMEELNWTPGAAQDRYYIGKALAANRVDLGHHEYRQLPRLYANNDVFVFPSVSETFGHPMVEAMASGLPVVAADTAINREICGDGAIYFRPFSLDELVTQLRRLDEDEGLRQTITENAQRIVSAKFKWEHHVDRLIETFEEICSRYGRVPRRRR